MQKTKFSEFESLVRVEYIVFGQCNTNCNFCYQKNLNIRKSKLMSYDSIITRFGLIEPYLVKNFNENWDGVFFSLLGGELFCWEDSDLVLAYKKIADIILELQGKLNKKCMIGLVTNLLYRDTTDLYKTFGYMQSLGLAQPIITSFDFFGRYNNDFQFEIFKHNIMKLLEAPFYKEYGFVIEMTRTKPMLETLRGNGYEDKLEFLDFIYNHPRFSISMANLNYLVSQKKDVQDLILNFDESIECYKLMYQKYPRLVADLINLDTKPSFRTCLNRTKFIISDKIYEKPCFYEYYGDVEYSREHFRCIGNSKLDILESFIDRYGCEYCEFYTQCSLDCPMQRNSKASYDKCDIKEFYKWIKNRSVLCQI